MIDEPRTKGAKVHFVSLVDIYHLKNAELEAKHQKYKGRVRVLCSIHRTRIISITSNGSKSHEHHLQTVGLRKTSSRRRICLYPGKNGRCTQIIENSKIGMSRHRLPRHKWPKSWSNMDNPNGNLKMFGSNTVREKFQIGNAYSYTVEKVILFCVCG